MNEFIKTYNLIDRKKIKEIKIAVIGLGGVGAIAAEALVRSGIRNIILIDFDRVELSNINRQIPAYHSTLGEYKTEVLKQRFLDINPELNINTKTVRASKDNFEDLMEDSNFVIDAIDSLSDKADLIEYLFKNKIPFVSSMGTANRIDPLQFDIVDISKTKNDPLAKRLRKELKKRGIEKGFDVVISYENPIKDKNLSSLMFVTATAGLLLSYYTFKKLELFGKNQDE